MKKGLVSKLLPQEGRVASFSHHMPSAPDKPGWEPLVQGHQAVPSASDHVPCTTHLPQADVLSQEPLRPRLPCFPAHLPSPDRTDCKGEVRLRSIISVHRLLSPDSDPKNHRITRILFQKCHISNMCLLFEPTPPKYQIGTYSPSKYFPVPGFTVVKEKHGLHFIPRPRPQILACGRHRKYIF